MTVLLAVLSPFLLALIAPAITGILKGATHWLLALLPAALFVFFASHLGTLAEGEVITAHVEWVPSLGVGLSFLIDGLSLTFALLILGIGACVVLYAGGYLHGHPAIGRFYLALLLFMGAMLGVVLADNLITLFIFWELTSFSSFLLIGFNHESQKSRDAAIQALVITGLGGLAMLAGLILMGNAAGTWTISEILASGDLLREHELYLPIFILVLCGAFTKSAQFPFHFWLPGAMQAPTPVSAYLHSATMVKAGVYLLARLNPVLGDTELWMIVLSAFGAVTMLVGSIVSLMKTDMKLVLAGSTIMALGVLVMLIGIGTPYAITAMGTFLVVHSLYKGALFMVAGAVDHEAGTREVLILGGLRKLMPVTFVAAAIASLSMAGIPPMFGFIGKELVYEAALGANWLPVVLIAMTVASSVMIFAVGGIVAVRPFFGKEHPETPKHAHEAPISMLIGPVLLAALSLVFGLMASPDGTNLIDANLLQPLASAIAGTPMETNLHLWHGFNLPLALTGVTIALGLLTYLTWDRTRAFWQSLDPFIFSGCQTWFFEKPLAGLLNGAGLLFRNIQNGNLRHYFIVIFTASILAVGVTMGMRMPIEELIPSLGVPDARFYEIILCVLIVAGAIGAARARTHLTAIITLGMVGYSIALLFVAFGAPDLAMTQFLVETLTVILVALVLIHLPQRVFSPRRVSKGRDAVLAISFGTLITFVMLAITRIEQSLHLSEFFAENSVIRAYGNNIVNVILVDFRGVDTMGEIIVLAIAGVGVIAMLKFRSTGKDDGNAPASATERIPSPPPDADADPPPGSAADATTHPLDPREPENEEDEGTSADEEDDFAPAAGDSTAEETDVHDTGTPADEEDDFAPAAEDSTERETNEADEPGDDAREEEKPS